MTTPSSTHPGASTIDPGASQGARRATEEAPGSRPRDADTEVVGRATRRQFSPSTKRRILAEADQCSRPGELGALLRREGVYSSSLSTWRRQRDAADEVALEPQRRGPKPDLARADTRRIAELTRERDRLRLELDKAQMVIEVQKKLTALFALMGLPPNATKPESS